MPVRAWWGRCKVLLHVPIDKMHCPITKASLLDFLHQSAICPDSSSTSSCLVCWEHRSSGVLSLKSKRAVRLLRYGQDMKAPCIHEAQHISPPFLARIVQPQSESMPQQQPLKL